MSNPVVKIALPPSYVEKIIPPGSEAEADVLRSTIGVIAKKLGGVFMAQVMQSPEIKYAVSQATRDIIARGTPTYSFQLSTEWKVAIEKQVKEAIEIVVQKQVQVELDSIIDRVTLRVEGNLNAQIEHSIGRIIGDRVRKALDEEIVKQVRVEVKRV